MKIRKLQKTGGGTYTISLPKQWIPENVKKGNKAYLNRTENNIQLYLKKEEEPEKRFVLRSSGNIKTDKRKIVSAYLRNFEIIEIKDLENPGEVQEFVTNNLIGLEVSEISDTAIKCNDLSKPDKLPSENGLRRMCHTISSMLNTLEQSPSKLDKMDNILDKYYLLIVKQLNMSIKHPEVKENLEIERNTQIIEYRLIAKSIERIGDHIVEISKKEETEEENIESIKENFEKLSKNIFEPEFNQVCKIVEDLEEDNFKDHNLGRINRLMIDISETIMNFSIDMENNIKKWD
jgi:phosphate uptake regulator